MIKYEKCQPTPLPPSFRKTCPWTILLSPFKNFSESPLQGRKLKFNPHPFKKKGEGGSELCVYRVTCVQRQCSRGALQEDVLQTWSNPQRDIHAEERSQQSCFATLLKSKHTQNTFFQENTSRELFEKDFERLKL